MAVLEVNHEELELCIDSVYETKLPLFIWGKIGIGKSETVLGKAMERAKMLNRIFIDWNNTTKEMKLEIATNVKKYFIFMDIRLSQFDPTDLRGIPYILGGEVAEWKIPFWLSVMTKEGAAGYIFFDEMNTSAPSIQTASYQIVLDRQLGEVTLSKDVAVIAAGNRVEDRGNVFDMADPLLNRFTHATLKPPIVTRDITGWTKWALDKGVDSRIITFLQARPNFLSPDYTKHSNDRAFPSPRMWGKYLNKLIKNIPTSNLDKILLLASISVGTEVAGEFVSFLKLQRKVNLDEILKNPKKASEIKDMDLKFSLLSLMAEWYAIHHTKENLDTLFQVANNIDDEFGILMLKFSRNKCDTNFSTNAMKLKSWDEISERYGKYLFGCS